MGVSESYTICSGPEVIVLYDLALQLAAAPPEQAPQLQLSPNLAALFGPQNDIPAVLAPPPKMQPEALDSDHRGCVNDKRKE